MRKRTRKLPPEQLPLFMPIRVPLTQGYVAFIDPVDSDLLEYNWCVHTTRNHPTAMRHDPRNGSVAMHRVVLERKLGRSLTDDEEVDHINRRSLDNRRANLRACSHFENMQNQGVHRPKRPQAKPENWDAPIYKNSTR